MGATIMGRKTFVSMALAHEQWVVDLFGGLTGAQQKQLNTLLGHLKFDMNQNQTNSILRGN